MILETRGRPEGDSSIEIDNPTCDNERSLGNPQEKTIWSTPPLDEVESLKQIWQGITLNTASCARYVVRESSLDLWHKHELLNLSKCLRNLKQWLQGNQAECGPFIWPPKVLGERLDTRFYIYRRSDVLDQRQIA
jgi:hypothetical protein